MEKPFYKSRKFQIAVALCVFGILKEFGIPIPDEIIYAAIASILGLAAADFGKNATKPPVIPPVIPPTPSPPVTIPREEKKPSETEPTAKVESVPPPRKAVKEMTPQEAEYDFIYGQFQERLNSAESQLTRLKAHLAQHPEIPTLAMAYQPFIEYWEDVKTGSLRSIEINKDLVKRLKEGGVEPWALGPHGYRILGLPIPWEK